MFTRRSVLGVFVLALLTTFSVAQGTPTVYVTTTGGVQSIDTSTWTATLFTGVTGPFQGVVFGPDGRLYACDPAGDRIVRFDPSDPTGTLQTVSQGIHAQCGAFSTSGDFYVTSTDAGSGLWVFSGAATAASLPAATRVATISSTFTGGSLIFSNPGDLFIVDNAGGKLWLATAASGFTSVTQTASGLSSPTGIAKRSTGELYVANTGAGRVVKCTAAGTGCVTAFSFTSQQRPYFLKFTSNDTLYIGTSKQNGSAGTLWSVAPASTTLVQRFQEPGSGNPPLFGVSTPNTASDVVGPKDVQAPAAPKRNFYFGFTSLEVTSPGCFQVGVQQRQRIPSATRTLLSNLSNTLGNFVDSNTGNSYSGSQLSLVPYPGEGGMVTSYPVTSPNCSPNPEALIGTYAPAINFMNPRLLWCHPTFETADACGIVPVTKVYPDAGPLPGDGSTGGLPPSFSELMIVNLPFGSTELGAFCGFQSPLTNATSATDPNIAPFGTGQNLAVKFTIALKDSAGNFNCQNGPFITDALALLSVARVRDQNSATVFNPIDVNSSGNSGLVSPSLFDNTPSNKQYQYSLSLKGYARGTYQITVTFLTGNAPVATTYFKIQ